MINTILLFMLSLGQLIQNFTGLGNEYNTRITKTNLRQLWECCFWRKKDPTRSKIVQSKVQFSLSNRITPIIQLIYSAVSLQGIQYLPVAHNIVAPPARTTPNVVNNAWNKVSKFS